MKKLQAAMRDNSAKAWREKKEMYKVGSFIKGCNNCGEWYMHEMPNGRTVKRYTSGFNVFRLYYPSRHKDLTYYCYDCAARNEKAWENASDIGLDAIVGARDAVAASKKYRLNQSKMALATELAPSVRQVQQTKIDDLSKLRDQLLAMLAKAKGEK